MEWKHVFGVIAERFGTTPEVVQNLWFEFEERLCTGQGDPIEMHHRLCEITGHPIEPDFNLLHFAAGTWTKIDEMQDFTAECAKDFKVGLLTNIYNGMLDYLIDCKTIDPKPFSQIVDSSAEGFAKPGEDIFRVAEKKAGVPPEEILFIDDTLAHIQGAAKLNWNTFHFQGDDYQKNINDIKLLIA